MKPPFAILAALVALFHFPAALAEDGVCHCPRCRVACVPNREFQQEQRTAYDVECKWICVPKIRFPWEPCCEPKCAYVRKVKTLKKIEYECPHCKYTWTATCDCPTCPGTSRPAGACAPPQSRPPLDPPPLPPAPPTARRLFPFISGYFDGVK